MTTRRYIELRLLEALEYIKYSKEDSWSFVVRVDDKKICFTGDKIGDNEIDKKNETIDKFIEALTLMEFDVDKQHIVELINDLKKVRLFKYINECINELNNNRNTLVNQEEITMISFTIQRNNSWYTNPTTNTRQRGIFISRPINAFYHADYHGGNNELRVTIGSVENIITTLKNQFQDKTNNVLMQAKNNLIQILRTDLPQILQRTGKNNLTVCVIPRAKADSYYSANQMLFKQAVIDTINQLNGFSDGTNFIVRHTNTRTTHLDRSGYGGDGDLPYPGITVNTCNISENVRGKDILLIDDLYTESVNIDEDAIQALLDNGATNVFFYSVGKTLRGG